MLIGVGVVLAELAHRGELGGRVRLIFQPAEESMPGGAIDVIDCGRARTGSTGSSPCTATRGRTSARIGVRVGPITGSSDHVRVVLTSEGGHTARPHLTGDLVYALAKIVTDVPSILSRRVDPRAGLSVVWGTVRAGGAANAIPQNGEIAGTVRSLDARVWENAEEVVSRAVADVARRLRRRRHRRLHPRRAAGHQRRRVGATDRDGRSDPARRRLRRDGRAEPRR